MLDNVSYKNNKKKSLQCNVANLPFLNSQAEIVETTKKKYEKRQYKW
jgi:hypothetical protein